jgi:hypothetical protein
MGKNVASTTNHTPNRLSAEEVRDGDNMMVMIQEHPRTIALAFNVSGGSKLVTDAIMVMELGRHVDNMGTTQRFLDRQYALPVQTGGMSMLIDMIKHTYPITHEMYLSRTQGRNGGCQ